MASADVPRLFMLHHAPCIIIMRPSAKCPKHFAAWPAGMGLQLVGRFSRPESYLPERAFRRTFLTPCHYAPAMHGTAGETSKASTSPAGLPHLVS